MMPFASTDLYTGPVARALGGADVAMPVGLLVATAVYLLAYRSVDISAELRLAAAPIAASIRPRRTRPRSPGYRDPALHGFSAALTKSP